MNGIQLLSQFICQHPYLKIEDEAVVKQVCTILAISESEQYDLINSQFRNQVEMEASMIYLTSKYSAIEYRIRQKLLDHKANKYVSMGSVDDSGYKWVKDSKENYLRGTDADYGAFVESADIAYQLLNSLKGLSTVVFNRDRKLEQLSINFRREVEIDKRTTY